MICSIFETFLVFQLITTFFCAHSAWQKKRKWRLSASIFKIIGFINVKNRDKKSHKRAPLRIYVHLNILVLNVWILQKWREVSFLLYYLIFPDTSYTKTGSPSQEVLRCGGMQSKDYTAKTKYRNLETNIPRKGISGSQSQFPHSCVCERFIYSHDWSAGTAAKRSITQRLCHLT